jgi:acetyltransferase-like isoleucine patch superfamily enzyme
MNKNKNNETQSEQAIIHANKNKEDVHSKTSNRTGLAGLFESFLRRFRILAFILALIPVYLLAIFAMGISVAPGLMFFSYLSNISANWTFPLQYIAMGFGLAFGYFIYGFTLIFVIPFFNFIMPFRAKPFRGSYYSIQSVPWYIHNAFIYIVRYTFLEFITPTPLNILFYKMMGMKIGKGVHINTTNISDACLIELEDYVTIGGSATIIAHYAAKGYLVLSNTRIKKGATIGLRATLMGDIEIGEGATIAPNEVVLPKSRIPAGRKPDKNGANIVSEGLEED